VGFSAPGLGGVAVSELPHAQCRRLRRAAADGGGCRRRRRQPGHGQKKVQARPQLRRYAVRSYCPVCMCPLLLMAPRVHGNQPRADRATEFRAFQSQWLAVYLVIMLADWLQVVQGSRANAPVLSC
jgi:hypothetical protein